MQDFAVDQHSTWMDQCTQPPIQRPHSDHQDITQDATSDKLHHFCTLSEYFVLANVSLLKFMFMFPYQENIEQTWRLL